MYCLGRKHGALSEETIEQAFVPGSIAGRQTGFSTDLQHNPKANLPRVGGEACIAFSKFENFLLKAGSSALILLSMERQ